jgi:hypothetical protein
VGYRVFLSYFFHGAPFLLPPFFVNVVSPFLTSHLVLVENLLSHTLFCFAGNTDTTEIHCIRLYCTRASENVICTCLVPTRNNSERHTHTLAPSQPSSPAQTPTSQSSTDATLSQIGESCNLEISRLFYSSSSLSSKALSGPALHLTLTHRPISHIKARSSADLKTSFDQQQPLSLYSS